MLLPVTTVRTSSSIAVIAIDGPALPPRWRRAGATHTRGARAGAAAPRKAEHVDERLTDEPRATAGQVGTNAMVDEGGSLADQTINCWWGWSARQCQELGIGEWRKDGATSDAGRGGSGERGGRIRCWTTDTRRNAPPRKHRGPVETDTSIGRKLAATATALGTDLDRLVRVSSVSLGLASELEWRSRVRARWGGGGTDQCSDFSREGTYLDAEFGISGTEGGKLLVAVVRKQQLARWWIVLRTGRG